MVPSWTPATQPFKTLQLAAAWLVADKASTHPGAMELQEDTYRMSEPHAARASDCCGPTRAKSRQVPPRSFMKMCVLCRGGLELLLG